MIESSGWITAAAILLGIVVYLGIGVAFTVVLYKLHIVGFLNSTTVLSLLFDFDNVDEAAIVAIFWPIFVVGLLTVTVVAIVLLPLFGIHWLAARALSKLLKHD